MTITAYWTKKCAELHENPSAFYKTFKSFINARVPDVWLRTSDASVTSNQTKVTNLLANYFTTAASNIQGDHVNNLSENDHQFNNSVKTIREVQSGAKFKFTKFRQGEVTRALETLNLRKSSGWNHGKLPILLKKLTKAIAPSLISLDNECIESRKWPTNWKMGE